MGERPPDAYGTPRRILVVGRGRLVEVARRALDDAGAEVLHLPEPTDREIRDAMSLPHDAVMVISRDDHASLRLALVIEGLHPGVRLLSLSVADDVGKVSAVDSSRAMSEYLHVNAESAELSNVRVVVASVTSVPLVDCIADLVLSNYCLHELADREKRQALSEAFRLLRPGGRASSSAT